MLDDLERRRDARQTEACRPDAILDILRAAFCGARKPAYPQGASMARIEVKSEITGTVWQVKSKPGDNVESGDTLVVIESMKMEIPVITEDPGVVKQILVKEKDPVAEGQVVAVLEG
jgi:acetyl-CoA carboxylase biotin carboxyl carrier protein